MTSELRTCDCLNVNRFGYNLWVWVEKLKKWDYTANELNLGDIIKIASTSKKRAWITCQGCGRELLKEE